MGRRRRRTGFGGTPGVWRLFNASLGGEVAWLLPLAAAGLVAGLWLTRRAARTDRGRAGWVLWGGWFVVCAAVFSLSKGIFHPYYAIQLAPAVAALAGAGAVALWHAGRRSRWLSWLCLSSFSPPPAWPSVCSADTPLHPWLRPAISVAAVVAAVGLFAALHLHRRVLSPSPPAWPRAPAGRSERLRPPTISHQASGSIPVSGPRPGGRGGGPGGSSSTDWR